MGNIDRLNEMFRKRIDNEIEEACKKFKVVMSNDLMFLDTRQEKLAYLKRHWEKDYGDGTFIQADLKAGGYNLFKDGTTNILEKAVNFSISNEVIQKFLSVPGNGYCLPDLYLQSVIHDLNNLTNQFKSSAISQNEALKLLLKVKGNFQKVDYDDLFKMLSYLAILESQDEIDLHENKFGELSSFISILNPSSLFDSNMCMEIHDRIDYFLRYSNQIFDCYQFDTVLFGKFFDTVYETIDASKLVASLLPYHLVLLIESQTGMVENKIVKPSEESSSRKLRIKCTNEELEKVIFLLNAKILYQGKIDEVLSGNDIDHFLKANFEIYDSKEIPKKLDPKCDKGTIRYLFYIVHSFYLDEIGQDKVYRVLVENFKCFENESSENFKKHFSQQPKRDVLDLVKLFERLNRLSLSKK